MAQAKYDHERIAELRALKRTWPEVADEVGYEGNPYHLRRIHGSWLNRRKKRKVTTEFEYTSSSWISLPEGNEVERTGVSKHRITSLTELFEFFEIPFEYVDGKNGEPIPVSPDYEVLSFKVNSWEQHSVKKGVVTLYQVKATLRPKEAIESREVMEQIWSDMRDDFETHVAPTRRAGFLHTLDLKKGEQPQMLEIILNDPHLGMLAWGKECGVPYDLDIGERDYRRAFEGLLSMARHYNVGKILYLVGNDLFHVDGPGFDAKGGSRGGATTKGTSQDIDTRLARMFTHVRRLIVDCIDATAAMGFDVDVQMVPGNHDRHTLYKLGEVLSAWYRNEPKITVHNSPSVRTYYRYGANVFMFTHGEEFNRNRDNLATIFATECPPEMWVQGKIREIHVGHNHINKQKVWDGRAFDEVWEGRAIRARSLPGLTPEDSWHFESGYKHMRRGTVIVWNEDGGMAGYHEFTL